MKQTMHVYVGTYSRSILFGTGETLAGKGQGIHHYELELDTGRMHECMPPEPADNPSYLAVTRDSRFLYAVNEIKEFAGQATGAVSAYSIDPVTKELHLLCQRPSGGTDPCYVSVSEDTSCVMASNFMSGSVCTYPVREDGTLAQTGQFVQHHGCGVDPIRQTGPHAHAIVLSPDERFAFVPDLGIDRLIIYPVDLEKGLLNQLDIRHLELKPGSGPRCCVFNRTGDRCYLFCELICEIWVLAHDGNGNLTVLQKTSSMIESCAVQSIGADIHLSPDGRFLYASNRGQDSIVVYHVLDSGLVEYVQTVSTRGRTPRNFAIDPAGRFLLSGNQDSDNIVVFTRDMATGKLSYKNQIYAPTPVCIRIGGA